VDDRTTLVIVQATVRFDHETLRPASSGSCQSTMLVFVYCYSLSTLLTNEQLADEQKMEQKNVLKNNK
jgi:hypothetical protein